MSELVVFDITDGVATLRLNRPDNRNALTAEMSGAIVDALDEAEKADNVRCLVITGTDGTFCAGGDINALKKALETDPESSFGVVRKVGLAALRIRNARKPVIASINGAAAGAGFNLALACDFRICADNAKFIQSFVNLGLVPDMGGTFFLTKMIGAAKATELIMTGRTVKAEEAEKLGLVNQVVSVEELENKTKEFAATLASSPTRALGNMKALINRSAFDGLENILDNELEYQIQCAKTEDFKEGVTAFLEKRPPTFKGK